MIAPARRAAYRVLRAVTMGRADLPHALARARVFLDDERDRALAYEIVTGVLRWQAELDYVVARIAQRPLDRLDAEVLDILRIGAYQLLHLERIPARTAVDDAVDLTRTAAKSSAAGFVNAVLRAVARIRNHPPLPPRPGDNASREATLDYLSISLSHPRWLVARWLDRYGFEAVEAWARFNNTPAPLTLRANRLKISLDDLVERLAHAGVVTRRARYAPDGLIVTRGNPLTTALADSGLFIVQDEASQLVSLLAMARPGARILDACASPGGKTTALAADMNNDGLLVAADARRSRLELLRRTITACQATCVRMVQVDLRVPLPFGAAFDCVMVDAPCTGLGTIRRDPDIRWRRRERDLGAMATTQQTMLRHAGEGTKAGGLLIYATCSSEPEENEDTVAAFLTARGEFELVNARPWFAALRSELAELVDDAGHLRTYPHVHGLDAFFGAVLRRRGAVNVV